MKVATYSFGQHHPCTAGTTTTTTPSTSYCHYYYNAVRTVKPPPLTVRCCAVTSTRIEREDATWTRGVELGKMWREYQGVSNWEGLLDPLDDNLRREILRYGGFVDAAYKSFDFDAASPSYGACKYSKRALLTRCGLRDSGYRLTRHLAATSGVPLPRWAPPSLTRRRSSWIGFVAVSQDRRVESRLGRRDVVVSLRGTATPLEWLENLRAALAPVGPGPGPGPMVESGFLSLYTSGGPASLRDTLRAEVDRLLRAHGGGAEPVSITITGHSLGAALATLAAYDLKDYLGRRAPIITVISFGGPRVGDRRFRCGLERRGIKVLRIVNSDDLVTKLPPGGWLATPWVYAEVGEELRLTSRDSNGFSFDFATCHDLRTYLHLVENFVGSNCPIRATARKLLRTS